MASEGIGRRSFIQAGASGIAALALAQGKSGAVEVAAPSKPALLGGKPVRQKDFPEWPQIDGTHEKTWQEVLKDRGWCRLNGEYVQQFEEEFAKAIGTKYCLAVANGTSALIASLNARIASRAMKYCAAIYLCCHGQRRAVAICITRICGHRSETLK